jgi:hypothetical protein
MSTIRPRYTVPAVNLTTQLTDRQLRIKQRLRGEHAERHHGIRV